MKPHQKLHQWLQQENAEAILISKPENIGYLSNFWGSFGLYLQTVQGERVLLTDGRYQEIATKLATEKDFKFELFKGGVPEKFVSLVKSKLAVEDTVTLAGLKRYEKWFENVNITSHSGVVETLRRVKSEAELSLMRQSQAHVDAVLIEFLKANLRAGMTERQLKFKLDQLLMAEGRYGLSFDSIVAFGEGSALPHYISGDRKLNLGDNILIDCGVVDRHYCSDMTRNFVLGSASDEYKKDYAMLLQEQQKVMQAVKAEVEASALDLQCREGLGTLAELFVHSLGHGVGLEIHEAPTLSSRSKDVLQVNEVVTIEPGIYKPSLYGIRIEDSVIVQQHGSEVLTKTTKDLLSFNETGDVQIILQSG